MASLYYAQNGAAVTTAAFVPVTTGTAIKTMLQVKTSATGTLRVVKWGISFDGTAGTTPIKCELISTGAIGATVTQHVAAGVQPYGPDQSPSGVDISSTTATGYTASAEGTITTTRWADEQQIYAGNYFQNEWSLDREFFVPVSTVVRIRVTATVAVNCTCFLLWEE